MKRLSQTIERVRYELTREAVRRAIEDYMDSKHNVILPANWTTEAAEGEAVFVVADYITE